MTQPALDMFPPNRDAALKRLDEFLPNAGRAYASTRNFDYGPEQKDNVSTLSPYVTHRLISETEILRKVMGAHSASAADKYISEVFWRGYFKGWLENHPNIWDEYCESRDAAFGALSKDKAMRAIYEKATAGELGREPMDSWTNELIATGYLHNHTRMWFASIWIFTLQLPWELGADFFYRHLLDGDPASNTLSWRWVAGLHTKGKTYLARQSNIEKFTDGRFERIMDLASEALALSEEFMPESAPLPVSQYPQSGMKWGLLPHEGDLDLSFPSALGQPTSVSAYANPAARSPQPISDHVSKFTKAATDDALSRAKSDGFETAAPLSSVDDIIDWASTAKLDAIVMPYVPTGSIKDSLSELSVALSRKDVKLCSFVREYDSQVWPHANRGFFKLKKKIPKILTELGLT